jgi:multicomponent Na+:H+ antiporter subunit G
MNPGALAHAVLTLLGSILALGGALAIAVGVLGLLRFPDAYNRLHATSAGHFFGAPLFVIGMAVMADTWHLALRLILLALLIVVAMPAIAHFAAATAHAAGLTPITGPYRAPRPGAHDPGRGFP